MSTGDIPKAAPPPSTWRASSGTLRLHGCVCEPLCEPLSLLLPWEATGRRARRGAWRVESHTRAHTHPRAHPHPHTHAHRHTLTRTHLLVPSPTPPNRHRQALLDAGAPVDQARDDGATPLYKACQDGGSMEIAEMLIKAGASVNKPDPSGMTPLWLAIHQGRPKLVKYLLDANADPTHRVQGWSVLELAKREGHDEIAALLHQKLQRMGGAAAVESASGVVQPGGKPKPMLTAEEAAEAARSQLVSALYGAAHHGHEHTVRKCLAEGADVDAIAAAWEATALYAAAKAGEVSIGKMLLQANADVDKGHRAGQTPLAAACANGHVDMARLLLAAGADIEVYTPRDPSPLLPPHAPPTPLLTPP